MVNLLTRDTLDYETATSHQVSVKATKPGQPDIGPTTFTIHVTDVAETPLSAPVLERTTGAATYPPQTRFSRPIDWTDGCSAVMQRSTDASFATGVSEKVNTIYAATTTYDFDLDTIASGSVFMRMAAWDGTRPSDEDLEWSNITNVGDVTDPTITSDDTPSGYRYLAGSMTLTADEAVIWTITGGANASAFTLAGSTLSWAANAASSLVVQVTATDYAGNATDQTITLTLAVNNPNAFTFTDVTGATTSTLYTSNTITLAGGQTSTVWPYSFSGSGTPYIKVGGLGSWVAAGTSGSCAKDDQFKIEATSSANPITTVSGTLTVGGISDTYSVSTEVPITFGVRSVSAGGSGSSTATVAVAVGVNLYFIFAGGGTNKGPSMTATVDGNAATVYHIGEGTDFTTAVVVYESASAHASKTLALSFTGSTTGLNVRHIYMTGFDPVPSGSDGWNFDNAHNMNPVAAPSVTVAAGGVALAWTFSAEAGGFVSAGSGCVLVGADDDGGGLSEGAAARPNTGVVSLNMGSGTSGFCDLFVLAFDPT